MQLDLEPMTVVDLGAGYGSLVALIANIFGAPYGAPTDIKIDRYVAVDRSPEMLAYALRRAVDHGLDARGHIYDFDDATGDTPSCAIGDVVVLSFMLTHVKSAASALRLAAHVVKRDGFVLVVDADYASARAADDAALEDTIHRIHRELPHAGFAQLDAMAADAGLRRVSGLFDGIEEFGPSGRSAKDDALPFIGNFLMENPVRRSWNEIRGGILALPHVRRGYVKADG